MSGLLYKGPRCFCGTVLQENVGVGSFALFYNLVKVFVEEKLSGFFTRFILTQAHLRNFFEKEFSSESPTVYIYIKNRKLIPIST